MKRVFLLLIACFASMIMSAQMHWTPIDEGLYSGSTTVIAVVQINGVEQTSDQIEVAVFCGDECRGTALTGEFPITHRYIAQVNVYGENGHQLTFKAYDHATNMEMENDPEVTVQFTEDGSGTLFAPLELNFIADEQPIVMHWTPIDEGLYSGSTTVIAVVKFDGVEQTTDKIELAVFCGDECRGTALTGEFPITHRYIAQVNVYGENGHQLTFKAYNHITHQEMENNPEVTVTFTEDGSGTLFAPLELNFVTTTPATNTTPGDWNDPTIWGGTVPDASASVELGADCTIGENGSVTVTVANLAIPASGAILTVEAGSTLIVTGELVNTDPDNLILESGAELVNASADVQAKAKKSVQGWNAKDSNGWYLISSSVNGMEIAGSEFLAEIYDLYRYNETDVVWENYRGGGHADFTTFEKGRGYLYANSNGISPAFIGTLNNADVTYQVTAAAASTASRGINIIGNPFPHKIYKGVGGAIDDSNLETGYYELTYAGAWLARTYDVAIQPGQGVLVVAKTSGNLNIAKSNSAATAETASSKGNVNRLTINVEGNGNKDIAYAYFSDGDGLDKLDNFSSSAAQIAIKSAGKEYAIAHVGGECETMDIVFKNTKSSYYTITFESIDEFSYLHLIDKITGEDVDMLLENEYKFYATGSEYDDRFMIVCRSTQGVGGNYENETFAYVSNNSVIVNGKGELHVFDIAGRTVMNMAVDGVETLNTLPQGVYVFRMIEENIVKTQKIVVR
ncbi:MAG: T9SS type A sorting domain-containing protein [Bacteroidales bacterium]|nr:T9SS type A sorting domain-containing protein [Bacteroidales bacterium]